MRTLPSDYSAVELDLHGKRLISHRESHLDGNRLGAALWSSVHFLSIAPLSGVFRLNASMQMRMQDRLLFHAIYGKATKELVFHLPGASGFYT